MTEVVQSAQRAMRVQMFCMDSNFRMFVFEHKPKKMEPFQAWIE